jgi:uncharacterized protein (DUF433 family)
MTLPDFLTRDADHEIRLTGHRIGLYSVARLVQSGRSAEAIGEEFPSLPPALVAQVVEFYRHNRDAVDAYVAEYRRELARQEASHVPGPAESAVRRRVQSQAEGRTGNGTGEG